MKKIPVKRIIQTCAAYGIVVFCSEIILGNPRFPLRLWEFTAIPAWQWSLPVHLLGFAVILLWTLLLIDRPAAISAAVSTVFFIAAETLNLLYFNFFTYGGPVFGTAASFGGILFLYLILCSGTVWNLRRKARAD